MQERSQEQIYDEVVDFLKRQANGKIITLNNTYTGIRAVGDRERRRVQDAMKSYTSLGWLRPANPGLKRQGSYVRCDPPISLTVVPAPEPEPDLFYNSCSNQECKELRESLATFKRLLDMVG